MTCPTIKRRRSWSPKCNLETKRQAVTSRISSIEVPVTPASAFVDLEPFPALSDNRSPRNQDDLASDQSQSGPTSWTQEGGSSIVIITRDMPDFGPRLESCNVKNADGRIEKPKPDNWHELKAILRQARTTPEASEQEQENFDFYLRRSINEQTMFTHVRDALLKKGWAHDQNASNPSSASWMRHVPIESNEKFRFADPIPDISYGWACSTFNHRPIEELLQIHNQSESRQGLNRSYCTPNPNIWWPFAAVQAKGPGGTFTQSRLANQHSAAIMLNNRFQLKRMAGLPLPYGQAFIFTIGLTETASLNCHWMSLDKKGEEVFWTKQLATWDLFSMELNVLNNARQAIRNCIEYARQSSFIDVEAGLSALRAQYSTSLTLKNAINAIREQQASLGVAGDT